MTHRERRDRLDRAIGARRCAGAICALLALCMLCAPCSVARANAAFEEGKRLAFVLEFEPALAAFERALASHALTRAELVELLSERALLWYALQRQSELADDLTWLAALAPEHRLDSRAPPALVASWESVRDGSQGLLGVEVKAHRTVSRFEARAALIGTVPKHARARLVWRTQDGPWRTEQQSELHAAVSGGESVELYAEAVGLGELVVARSHSPDAPLQLAASAAIAGALPPWSAADRAPGLAAPATWLRRHQVWLLGGAALAVVAAVVAVAIAVPRAPGEDERATNLKPVVSF